MKTETFDSIAAANKNPDSAATLLAAVAGHPFLRGLSPHHLELLATCAMESHFEVGDLIFTEGDPANRFYLLKTGKVVLLCDGEGEPTVIQTLGPGDVLGWSWLFPPFYWHFDARAEQRTDAIFFYGTRLRELCEEDHDLGYELMNRTARVVIKRLMSARQQLVGKHPTA
jgi:CRP-like cAMP-binding protein